MIKVISQNNSDFTLCRKLEKINIDDLIILELDFYQKDNRHALLKITKSPNENELGEAEIVELPKKNENFESEIPKEHIGSKVMFQYSDIIDFQPKDFFKDILEKKKSNS